MSSVLDTINKTFKVESASSVEKKLKEAAENATGKAENLHKVIHHYAMKMSAEAGLPHPSEGEANYEYKKRMHEDHMAHHARQHPKYSQSLELEKEAASHRLAYKRFMRTKTK